MDIFPDTFRQEQHVVVTVSKWGNSLGLRLPRGIAEDAQLAEGTAVDVRIEKGRIIIERASALSLDSLLDRITEENRHGDAMPTVPIGREVL